MPPQTAWDPEGWARARLRTNTATRPRAVHTPNFRRGCQSRSSSITRPMRTNRASSGNRACKSLRGRLIAYSSSRP